MTRVRVHRYSGCCGHVASYYDEEEPGLLRCDQCGKIDYPEAFEKMELLSDDIPCPICVKVTKHELRSFDFWSGETITICTSCNTQISHN